MARIRHAVSSASFILLGQGSFFLALLVIAHRATAGTVGILNQYVAIGTFIGSALAFRYEMACLSTNHAESFSNLKHVLKISATVAGFSSLLAFLIGPYAVLCVVFAFTFFVQQSVAYFYTSQRRFFAAFSQRIVSNIIFLACVVLLPSGIIDSAKIVFSFYCAASVLASLVSLFGIWSRQVVEEQYKKSTIWQFIVSNRNFALYLFPATVLGAILNYALPIVFPAWFGAVAAGYLAFAYRFGFFPVSLVGQAVGGVLRRDAMDSVLSGSLAKMLASFFWMLLVAGALYSIGAFALIEIVLRKSVPRWGEAFGYFYAMIPIFMMQIIYIPMSQTFTVLSRQGLDLLLQIFSAIILLIVLAVCHFAKLSALESIGTFALAGCIPMILGSVIVFRLAIAADDTFKKLNAEASL